MIYRYRISKPFRRALGRLNSNQRRAAFAAFKIFRDDPFDYRLRPHKIHQLSVAYGKTIYAVCIEADLRAVFYVEENTIWSVDIGTHSIYG